MLRGNWLDAAVAACKRDPTHYPAVGSGRRLDAIFLNKTAASAWQSYRVMDCTGIPPHRAICADLLLGAVYLTHVQLKSPKRFPAAAFVPSDDDDKFFCQMLSLIL